MMLHVHELKKCISFESWLHEWKEKKNWLEVEKYIVVVTWTHKDSTPNLKVEENAQICFTIHQLKKISYIVNFILL